MPKEHENSRYLTCPSNDSFQNLQKLKQLFFSESASYKNSLQRLFSNSKVTLHDEPINSEFFTYYAAQSSTPSKKSDEAKQSDTQSKLVDFFKNCIFSNQLFNCNQDPETRNKACMCKPIRKSKTNVEPTGEKNGKKLYDNSSNFKESDKDDSTIEVLKEPGRNGPKRDSRQNSKDYNESNILKVEPKGKQKRSLEYKNTSAETINNSKAKPISHSTDKVAKVVLHLPVDFDQQGSQFEGNQLKVVLCGNHGKPCNCDDSTNKSNKKSKKKTKGLETGKEYADEETVIEDEKLGPEVKTKQDKPKKSIFSCFKKLCKGKSKSKQNQTEDSKGSGSESRAQDSSAAKGNLEKCRICHKIDPESYISGDQADTLKLLIKMEARQNYRQINNIIKELNDQQDDIKQLRETYAKIVEHFPDIFGKNYGKGDAVSNAELQRNIKHLFEMYRDLSVKINEIHKLSANIAQNNSHMSNNHSSPSEKSHTKSLSKTPPEKSVTEDSFDSSDKSKTEENIGKSSTDNNLKKLTKSSSGSGSNVLHFEDEMPEKLPKSDAGPGKKHNCPCEINWGLYISNSAK